MDHTNRRCQYTTSDQSATLVMVGGEACMWSDKPTQFNPEPFTRATRIATELGAQPHRICLLKAASTVETLGHRKIIQWTTTDGQGESICADGVMVTETGTATIMQTADCPAVMVQNRRTRKTIFYHCGRPAGMPTDGKNIITQALQVIAPDGTYDALEVAVVGAICGQHFVHQDGIGREQADTYLKEYGEGVFVDVESRALDMRAVIKKVHLDHGLQERQINSFGPDCTYADLHCASHRQHLMSGTPRTQANTIILVTV